MKSLLAISADVVNNDNGNAFDNCDATICVTRSVLIYEHKSNISPEEQDKITTQLKQQLTQTCCKAFGKSFSTSLVQQLIQVYAKNSKFLSHQF